MFRRAKRLSLFNHFDYICVNHNKKNCQYNNVQQTPLQFVTHALPRTQKLKHEESRTNNVKIIHNEYMSLMINIFPSNFYSSLIILNITTNINMEADIWSTQ